MNAPVLHIAIDGPVGSGKSYVACELAKRLGITYLYTGAMYRALALACVRAGIGYKEKELVFSLLERITIDLQPPDEKSNRAFAVFLNNENVTEELFTPAIDQGSSGVSTIAEVRQFMVARQQNMARERSVVMEGRDIAMRVLPDAQCKIYLTASVEERAKRRYEQYVKKGIEQSYAEILDDTKIRDTQDMTRLADPLQKVPDAWELDTTGMSPEDVIERILQELNRRKLT